MTGRTAPGLVAAVVALSVYLHRDAVGQGTLAPGAREIIALSFANAKPGELPRGVKLLSGKLDVVDKDGRRMLRAVAPSEFLVTLPEVLPQDFTIEFDLIPKQSGNPEDLSFEGTPTISRTSSSAHVLWSRESQRVIGGGGDYQAGTPADLRETLPGQLTQILVSVEGETLKLYTNGQRLYTLDRRFARGRVLRVFLGGKNDDEQSVYLARLRIAAGAATTVLVSQQSGMTGAPSPTSVRSVQPAGGSTPAVLATQPTATAPASRAVTQGPVLTAQSTPRTSGALSGAPTAAQNLSRGVTLSGFTAAGGFTNMAPRTVALSGFTAAGGFTSLAPRAVALSGFTAADGYGSLAPRTVALSGFTAAGGFTSLAPRTVTLSGFTAAGGYGSLAPRTVALSGFTAAGGYGGLAPRTVALSGFTAAGTFPSLAPRDITLSGFTAAGSFITLAPRTITLSGWTVVGVPPNR